MKKLLKYSLYSAVVLGALNAGSVYAEDLNVNTDVNQTTVATAPEPQSEDTEKVNVIEVPDKTNEKEEEMTISTEEETASQPSQEVVEEHNTVTTVTPEEYEENVSQLKAVSMNDVYQMFTPDSKEHTLYIGRSTCPYCRKLSPELKALNELLNNQLEYLNTDGDDFDESAHDFLWKTVGIPGTPTILYLDNGEVVAGWLGSDGTAQEIYNHFKSFYHDVSEPVVIEEEGVGEQQIKTGQQVKPILSKLAPMSTPTRKILPPVSNEENEVSLQKSLPKTSDLNQVMLVAMGWVLLILASVLNPMARFVYRLKK